MKEVTITLLRRDADQPHLVIDELGRKPDAIYHEYVERWERLSETEAPPLGQMIRCIDREPTGRSFKYLDVITPELYDDDAEVRAFTDEQCFTCYETQNFMMYRLLKLQ